MGNSSTKESRDRPEPQVPTDRRRPVSNVIVPVQEPRRETKQERDARRALRERNNRLKERERSLREESIDGGYLVTLGTYVGPEDFSKPVVRQLMIERRIAPFWRGLNDHSSSWTEHQLVALARGKELPPADQIPESPTQPIPIDQQPSTSLPAASSSPRGRARTVTLSQDIKPQEIKLPHDPNVFGQPIEAYLYKDASECPICFLYYPPFLNRTRCCDQPICSECFVQIKRPDPHPPEHLDPNSPVPENIRQQEEEGQLVSEAAACPFCVMTDFGVTYTPPPFRRGLAYSNVRNTAAMSTSPLPTTTRRRGQSISADSPSVITTDRVRPDWAKKLTDARAQAARRAAAATALHTAAFMGDRPFRRRLQGDAIPGIEMFLAAISESSRNRRGERQNRTDDLEELMMMEAIRQSLQAEEERRQKEEREARTNGQGSTEQAASNPETVLEGVSTGIDVSDETPLDDSSSASDQSIQDDRPGYGSLAAMLEHTNRETNSRSPQEL